MKKLMIAAAAVAMIGGASAADFAGLYNLKFTLKTIVPKKTTCTKTDCTICDPATRSEGNYYENGTAKLEGVIAYCSICTMVGESFSTAGLALWDPVNKEPVFFNNAWKTAGTVAQLFANAGWGEKPFLPEAEAIQLGQEIVAPSNVFEIIDTTVYSKKSEKVGMDFVMDYKDSFRDGVWDLRAAGLGTWCWVADPSYPAGNKRLGYVRNVSGNVAGRIPWKTGYAGTKGSGYYWGATIVDSECAGAADYCATAYAGNWELARKDGVPAYGTWTMKRNDAATKKELYKSIPSWLEENNVL